MSELARLPNIGKVLEENLNAIGIETPQQLKKIGAKKAFLQIRQKKDPGACLHMLYGIQGAIENIPDQLLSKTVKQDLKEFVKSLE